METYMRHMTYTNKINKLINKFLARLKWIPLCNRYEIFEKMVTSYFAIREKNIKSQKSFLEDIDKDTFDSSLKT